MTIAFASAATPAFLPEVVALFVAGAAIAYVCHRLGLVPIAGFLIAGVVIGPFGLGLVRDRELVDAAAEMGVILLLFTIGIEFSLEKLGRIQRLIFVGGGLQVGLASLATVGVLSLFGVPWKVGLFTGFLVALSSTAIVLKLFGERGETDTAHAQVSLGLLIFQDLAIVVMVLLVPMLAGKGGGALDILWALGKAAGIIVLVLVVARRLMPRLLEVVARTCSPELFLLTIIAVCFGTAFLTNLAGVSLSLGAFLAGLLVSESRFSQHALGEILPLEILFSATFFVSVGMLLDLGFLVLHLPLVLLGIAAVLALKVATTTVSVRALGYPLPVAAASGLVLAQVGEFSFVLERAGREAGLSPAGLGDSGSQAFIAATVVLMVFTPALAALGARVDRRLAQRQAAAAPETPPTPSPEQFAHLANHVVVAGYGQAARRLVRVLEGSGIPYLITTLSPGGANEAEADGLPVLRGDSAKRHTLELARVEQAKMMVVADDDPVTAHRIAAVARTLNPTLRIVVRTRYMAEVEPLMAAGVDLVVAEELESIVQLFAEVLRDYRIPAEEIEAHEATIRGGGYRALRAEGPPAEPPVRCTLPGGCLETRTVVVRRGTAIVGESLAGLDLEGHFGLRVLERRRDGRPLGPDAATHLLARDELVLSGSPEAFARSAPLFGDKAAPEVDPPSVPVSPPLTRDVDVNRTWELRTSATGCTHLGATRPVTPTTRGCEECLRLGDRWVHLRLCMTCGHVGCCDSSKNRHATAHHHATTHPIMWSLEPGEDWGWCYVDEVTL